MKRINPTFFTRNEGLGSVYGYITTSNWGFTFEVKFNKDVQTPMEDAKLWKISVEKYAELAKKNGAEVYSTLYVHVDRPDEEGIHVRFDDAELANNFLEELREQYRPKVMNTE